MRVVVGMSGGVDSAVAALLLKRQGRDVVGVFMKNWDEQDEQGVCAAQQDWEDVQRTCEVIGIPYYAVNFAAEYRERVFTLFLQELQAGRTPNPDVLCNREIKFKAFFDFTLQLGAVHMATGHFVRKDGADRLLKGTDSNKDQSYFLYMLKKRQVAGALFPVGDLTKGQVRAIARDAGLPVAERKDSTGICFIGERNFKRFLADYLPAQPGPMLTVDGETVGTHDGLMYYTLGQRRGLGIGGRGDGRSFFVVDKRLEDNALIVAQGEDHPLLFSSGADIEQATWMDEPPCLEGESALLHARFRYRQPDQQVTMTNLGGGMLSVCFDAPQRAITPGQSAVFYNGDVCLGGGIIRSARRA
ncbi:MAG: tRNA 2-thiouridine(34) synthase MnmA [Christensenellales bacterium]|jgi:tRNA-specific 2-thiouridylase